MIRRRPHSTFGNVPITAYFEVQQQLRRRKRKQLSWYETKTPLYIAVITVGVIFVICSSVQLTKHMLFPKLLVSTSTTADDNDVQAITNNPRIEGGIHGCVRFATKFEARHIISWLHYHSKLGIAHFHLYFDSIHSNLTNPIEKKVYDLLQLLPYITLYNMQEWNLTTEYLVFDHCITSSHRLLKGDWVIEFDIDEVFAFQERLGEKDTFPSCQNDDDIENRYSVPTGALTKFVADIPPNVLAVIVPRIEFRTNAIVFPPETSNQMELYTHRLLTISPEAKVLVRTDTNIRHKFTSKHGIWSSVPGSVVYPCGISVEPKECDKDREYCNYEFNKTQYPQALHIRSSSMFRSPPYLYHYVTRSQHECVLKLKDLPSDNWRVLNAQTVCSHTVDYDQMIYDYGLYCAGKGVSSELSELYPSYSQEPYIF